MVRRVNDDLLHAIAAAKGAPTDGTDGAVMRLADDQFNVLVDLLTPGYELALEYKKQMALGAKYEADAQDRAKVAESARPIETSTDPLPPDHEPPEPDPVEPPVTEPLS